MASPESDYREKITNRISEALLRQLPFSGEEATLELKKIAARFEEKCYTTSASQSDYLRKMYLKMLSFDSKFGNTLALPQRSFASTDNTPPLSEHGSPISDDGENTE